LCPEDPLKPQSEFRKVTGYNTTEQPGYLPITNHEYFLFHQEMNKTCLDKAKKLYQRTLRNNCINANISHVIIKDSILQKVTILLKFLFNLVPIKSPMIYFGI
jgi:hypothetical protein